MQQFFVISVQRTGTTSTGRLFAHHGFSVATWAVSRRNGWARMAFEERWDDILATPDVAAHQVFEDAPWFEPELYERLTDHFPDARFVHLTRDADAWFRSMAGHSDGNSLGAVEAHAKMWDRTDDYTWLRSRDLIRRDDRGREVMPLWDKPTHYIRKYNERNERAASWFSATPERRARYFHCALEAPDKWARLAEFAGFALRPDADVHVNQSVPNTLPRRVWRSLRHRSNLVLRRLRGRG